MRLMITGAAGMLGRTLVRRLAGHDILGVDLNDLDLADAAAVRRTVADFRPDAVLHCAAMTAVDRCESEPEAAYRNNALATANVAAACGRAGARLVAFSTDYVFSGNLDRPYHEWDEPSPLGVYGRTKLAAERAVAAHCPDHLVCRLAWLYGDGGPSFLHTMLRAAREGRGPIRVVTDQIGNPTSADAVADRVVLLLDSPLAGVAHLTCEGEASWHEFAREIFAVWGLNPDLRPCSSSEYARPAPRPANSRLDKMALRLAGMPDMPHWRQALRDFHDKFPTA